MTDLYDPEDSFRVLSLGLAPGFDPITNPMISITFTTFPGLDYEVVSDDDLDSFELVPGAVLKADDFTETVEVPMLSGASGFWRIGKR